MSLFRGFLRRPDRLLHMLAHPVHACLRVRLGLESARLERDLRRLAEVHAGARADFTPDRNERLSRLLEYARRHVPYYRARFAEVGLVPATRANFTALPLLDKLIIRSRRSELIPDCIDGLPYFETNTGGSTGEPLDFLAVGYADPQHQRFFHGLLGLAPGDLIVACDGTAVPQELRDRGVFWVPKKGTAYGGVAFSSLYLTAETIPRYVAHLRELRPAMMRGYPSVIGDLARQVLQEGGQLGFAMKAIVLTSESTSQEQIATIRTAFRAPVHLQYGHSEASVFAYTADPSLVYRCSPFYGYTEVLGADGRHVAEGETGEVVVTGFHTWAMPFIRYRTGDLAEYGGDEGGIVRLARLMGRTQDIVYASDGQPVSVTALVFGCHYRAFAHMKKWQIVQDVPGAATIRIARADGFTQADEDEIRDNFRRIARIATHFEYVDAIPLTPRGKSQLLIQRARP